MNRVQRILCSVLCGLVLTAALRAQTGYVGPVIELVPTFGVNQTTLTDLVTGTSYSSGSTITVGNNQALRSSSFTVNGGLFSVNGSGQEISLPAIPNSLSGGPNVPAGVGFTIAVQLGPMADQNPYEIVFQLIYPGGNGDRNFALRRDDDARWWFEKRRDFNPSITDATYFWSKTWDPVSPCKQSACLSDTIYVSFQPNGQISLDEVAVISSNNNGVADQYSWKSGLLNFGYPLTGYNQADTSTPETQISDLTTPLQQAGMGSILFAPADDGTSAANYARIAVWNYPLAAETTYGTTPPTISNMILQDQSLRVAPQYNLYPQANWINCDSGQYEQPRGGAKQTSPSVQYWPDQLPTPCNVPSTPSRITAEPGPIIRWSAPNSPGTADYGVAPAIKNYWLTALGSSSTLTCTGSSGIIYTGAVGQNSIVLPSSESSCWFHSFSGRGLQLAAQGAGGSTTTSTPVIGLSPAWTLTSTPGMASNLSASQNTGGFTVRWQAPPSECPSTRMMTYRVSVSLNGNEVQHMVTSQTGAAFTRLLSGTTYTVTVTPFKWGTQGPPITITATAG